MPAPISPLERTLLSTVPRSDLAEVNELDVLRDVLTGAAGTPAQRNTLLRIIRHNQCRSRGAPFINRLREYVGCGVPANEYTPIFSKYSDQRSADPTNQEPVSIVDDNDDEEEDDNT